jgi:hypothetical protein
MKSGEALKKELVKILRQKMPSVHVVGVNSSSMTDSSGEAGVAITIVTRQRPPRDEAPRLIEVVDDIRTWLINRDDQGFPYVRLLTEDEAREVLN